MQVNTVISLVKYFKAIFLDVSKYKMHKKLSEKTKAGRGKFLERLSILKSLQIRVMPNSDSN